MRIKIMPISSINYDRNYLAEFKKKKVFVFHPEHIKKVFSVDGYYPIRLELLFKGTLNTISIQLISSFFPNV